MFLKINNKYIRFDLLGKTKKEVYLYMGKEPVRKNNNLWCYTFEASSVLKKTVMFIKFKNNKVCQLWTKEVYKNPFKKLLLWYNDVFMKHSNILIFPLNFYFDYFSINEMTQYLSF